MRLLVDALIVLLILTNLRLVASSHLAACIYVVALQGLVLGLLPLLVGTDPLTLRACVLSGLTMVLKGIIFPWLLLRALRAVQVRKEMEPLVGYTTSLLVGAVLLALAMWFGRRLPLPVSEASPLMVPLALFTIMIGLFAIVSRRKALTQVLGYLVMENGIYAFGLTFAREEPLLVELGTLLDIFMAVFVMGITIFHISREFDHIDTDRLSLLKD
ncbi:NADH-quinone oxidoreductase subunit K [Desulforhabdus sp. TSK]|uniref:NADH-quinone oxidoreductase subunit K n=1 Tax=Desulforhabdus sp. TSK TaxID=2925014 RepID=UPI001FC8C168|nr:NADH-quinone oxidoreductase subunit K [Desulforhabdus sp. TSK]GKT07133.1 hydrogenase [Desulforhabdus sp. TSK]